MEHLLEKAKNIKLLICDIDGVLTDGMLYQCDDGTEYRRFHVHDGFGLKLVNRADIEVAIITTSITPIIKKRMEQLDVKHLFTGQYTKSKAYDEITTKLGLNDEQVAYVGDDLPDLPLLKRVGLAVAVNDANPALLAHVHWHTKKCGGQGAVREVCDLLLQAQNSFEHAVAQYNSDYDQQ